ncbi:unnamed protein product [Ranitomeya imitator]|uniref:GIY-YIG domain-containing protein n=1 Tax=Ranitomeya imitator TaxID=111125 RepID=A0ABN9LB31_9NEOB|nr:unnamed protein product [Ranitomeya imitator]
MEVRSERIGGCPFSHTRTITLRPKTEKKEASSPGIPSTTNRIKSIDGTTTPPQDVHPHGTQDHQQTSTSGSDVERDAPSTSQAPFLGQRRRFPQRRRDGSGNKNDNTDRMRTILVTMDVKDLYTSIPHIEGINSVHHLLTLAGLDSNQIYLCVRGTAMGSNVAPPCTNAYMAHFEESIIYKHPLFISHVLYWTCYIDDIFSLWGGTLKSLETFFTFLNGAWPGIRFTITHDIGSISFLDTTVLKDGEGRLTTDLHVKPTDRNSILHYDSFHPPAVKRCIPRSQFQRVRRIVSDQGLRDRRLQDMSTKFHQRGYPERVLKEQQNPPPRIRGDDQVNRIPFVHVYHPVTSILHKHIRKHWPVLSRAYPTVPEFKLPFLTCFKRPQNLRDTLVRADFGHMQTAKSRFLSHPKMGTFPCLHCAQCGNVQKGNTFQHPRTGKSFEIRNYYTCMSSFVIYLIKCPCGLLYIGETTQPVRDRISKHKSTIRCNNLLLPVPHHFSTHGHTISQLRYQVIDSIPPQRRGGDRIALLKKREAFWIHTLETLTPKGLNRDYDLLAFI